MYTVEVNERDLTRLVSALNQEADGKALRRDLATGLRAAVEPAAALARGAILSMGSRGLSRATPPLRTAVAAAVKVEVRLSAKRASVAVVVRKHTMPRGFRNAPKRLNAAKGWRHPVFGSDQWVHQLGAPGWFDESMRAAEPAAKEAAKEALDEVARRIDMKTRG
jgi:hypothetical protein